MAETGERDPVMEDEDYDEEADSDFEGGASDPGDGSSSDGEEEQDADETSRRPRKRQKNQKSPDETLPLDFDSGDEATIRAQTKASRKQVEKPADGSGQGSGDESEGWRARTRAMRTKEKDERKRNKLASTKASTIDVDKIWEEMNRPGAGSLPPSGSGAVQPVPQSVNGLGQDVNKENIPVNGGEETITIKQTYRFAGEVHVEEKVVPKASAEAQLWLAQQKSTEVPAAAADGPIVNRPPRKISRFDPNVGNLGAFKGAWTSRTGAEGKSKGPKLNVVEKSKMDWAVHVDTEGLKDELDTHAKAKEGYLTRMDFLREVEERKEAESRAARLKGRG